ncbi:MAG: hypothetical protein R3F35_18110 [Myxococcota bacterium]
MGRTVKYGIWIAMAVGLGFLLGRVTAGDGAPDVDSPESMSRALRSAFVETDPMLRARAMNRLIPLVDRENLAGAVEVFRAFSTRAETLGVSEFFATWSRLDVQGLADAMASWPDEKGKSQGIGWVAYQYALEGGTDRAAPYYDTLTPRLRLVTGYRLIEGALNGGDEAGLVRWIGSIDDAAERNRLTQGVVLKLLRERDAQAVVAYFDRIPGDAPGQYKRQAFLVVLDKLVRDDAEAALRFRASQADEPWAENSMSQLMASWADVDPAAALAWVESQPRDDESDRALEALLDRWSAHDPQAAIDWTLTRPPSPMIDRLARRFTGLLTISQPDRAIALAARIEDPSIKHEALRAFARYWFLRRSEQTRNWLVAGGLSPEAAEGMIAELARTRDERMDRTARPPSQG